MLKKKWQRTSPSTGAHKLPSRQAASVVKLFGSCILAAGLVGIVYFAQYHNLSDLNTKIIALEAEAPSLGDTKQKLDFKRDMLSLRRDYKIAQNSMYASVIPMISGGFFILTAYVSWRNFKVAKSNLKVANETLQITQRRLDLDEEKLELERFTKVLEEVEDGSRKARQSAALYELAGIVKGADEDVQQFVVQFLIAFITDTSNKVCQHNAIDSSKATQAALKIIFSIKSLALHKDGAFKIDFSGANLTKVKLINSSLEGDDLQSAVLRQSDLDGANLRNSKLNGANLEKAYVGQCDFTGANLEGAILNQVNTGEKSIKPVTFSNATMRNVHIQDGALLHGSDFQHCILNDAKLISSDFSRCNFSYASLNGADLSGANLRYAIFTGANLIGVTWDKTDIHGADFTNAVVQIVNLKKSDNWDKAYNLDKAIYNEPPRKI